jgi:hypothetical protein
MAKFYSGMTDEELAKEYNEINAIANRSPEAEQSLSDVKHELEVRQSKMYNTVYLPSNGHTIGEFAETLAAFFGKHQIIFYRPVDSSVVRLDNGLMEFKTVKGQEFVTLVEKYFNVGLNTASGFIAKSLNAGAAEVVLSSEHQFKNKLPKLETIYSVPIPRLIDDALVFPSRGYDEKIDSWLPLDAPQINPNMQLSDALHLLDDIYSEFCFSTEQDKINAIAYLLTPFCRDLYINKTSRTPIFFFEANRERAGKDYCAGITGIVYEGEAAEIPPVVSDGQNHEDEFRKKITSIFKRGRRRIHSSNNKGHLNSAVLESMSTSQFWEDRQLGSNLMLSFPNTLEISLSANTGITFTPDFAARCIFVRLFFADEDPNKREFKIPDLHGYVRERRSEILSALFALVLNWKQKGMPKGSVLFSSFPEWARVVGGIMEAAGLGNPASSVVAPVLAGDMITGDMKTMYELCYDMWPEQWVSPKEIVAEIIKEDSNFNGLFSWLDWERNMPGAKIKFGLQVDKYIGRVMSGIMMKSDGNRRGRKRYLFTKKLQAKLGTLGTVGTVPLPPHASKEIGRDIENCTNCTNSTTLPTNPPPNSNTLLENSENMEKEEPNSINMEQNKPRSINMEQKDEFSNLPTED